MIESATVSSRDRIIDISSDGARLSVRNGLLVIESQRPSSFSLPLEDVAAVVLAHPCITLTQAVLSRLSETGAVVVVCDSKRLPAGMLLPLAGHFTQSERFAKQSGAPAPMRKRLWQQIVRAKIRAQGELLKRLRGTDRGLLAMSKRVRSGDPDNLEAQATRRYWPLIFDDRKFRRVREGEDQNVLLNYGYAVLRAMTARAICAAGLHPTIGLHHHNRYDAYCLADDLMEPLRPIVDEAVVYIVEALGESPELKPQIKAALVEALTGTVEIGGEKRTLFDALSRMSSSLAGVFEGRERVLTLPNP